MARPFQCTAKDKVLLMKRRAWILAGCLLALLATWGLFHRQIHQSIAGALLVGSETPDPELFEELARSDPDPEAFLRRCWATGKVTHRRLVAGLLKERAAANSSLAGPAMSLVIAGASDGDMSVRELSLAVLALTKSSRLFDCARAQLTDPDPLVRLMGLDYLAKETRDKALPVVIEMLDDPDPRVIARAEHALTRWTGEDFGVRSRYARNEAGEWSDSGKNAEKIRQGVERRKEWWSAHKSEFAAAASFEKKGDPRELSRPPAANFELKDLNNQAVQLSQFRGKVVLLNFWATWCTACLAEIPDLIGLQKQFGDRIAIVGVALDGVLDEHGHDPGEEEKGGGHEKAPAAIKIREKVERAVKSRGINYLVLLDPENSVGGRFNGGELPTTVIIDAEGRVVRRFIGERDLKVFEAMIKEASGKQGE